MSKGIIIVGLGPGAGEALTLEARSILSGTRQVFVRTARHPSIAYLPATCQILSFDEIYEHAANTEEVYQQIAAKVCELGRRDEGVVYAVPGHPLVAETSVQHILRRAREEGMPLRIAGGLSFIEPVCTALGLDPIEGLQIADATALALCHYPPFNPDCPVLLGQLHSRSLAADVKLALMMVYPDEHPLMLVKAAGTDEENLCQLSLCELDRRDQFDHLTTLYVPPLSTPGSFQAFQDLVARLRSPGGCPWDREQTHPSLRSSLLEETHEVLQALDDQDPAALKEELGDLLLQILLHSQIATEESEFRMPEVISQVIEKLKRRHPHVFGQTTVEGAHEVLANWERIKSEERKKSGGAGLFDSIPAALPALARAQAVQDRARRRGARQMESGHSWAYIDQALQALRLSDSSEQGAQTMGQLLFGLAGLACEQSIDAESALRGAVREFATTYDKEARASEVRGG